MKSGTSLKMGHIWSKTRSVGQIIEEYVLVIKELRFKSMLFNAILHDMEGLGERLQGHHGLLVF